MKDGRTCSLHIVLFPAPEKTKKELKAEGIGLFNISNSYFEKTEKELKDAFYYVILVYVDVRVKKLRKN